MINREEIENIATLSKLKITEDEMQCAIKDMQAMIDFAKVVCGKDADVQERESDGICASLLREDEAQQSLLSEQVVANAPECKESFVFLARRA